MQIAIDSLQTINKTAHEFIKAMDNKRVFAFRGEMGAGKTTFIKAVCEELGVKDVINSPSFAIVNEYLGKYDQQIFHFDFYRINNIEEAYDFGYEDYFYSGAYCFVEWPEKIEGLLPTDCVFVDVTESPDGKRTITITA